MYCHLKPPDTTSLQHHNSTGHILLLPPNWPELPKKTSIFQPQSLFWRIPIFFTMFTKPNKTHKSRKELLTRVGWSQRAKAGKEAECSFIYIRYAVPPHDSQNIEGDYKLGTPAIFLAFLCQNTFGAALAVSNGVPDSKSCLISKTFDVKSMSTCEVVEKRRKWVVFMPQYLGENYYFYFFY